MKNSNDAYIVAIGVGSGNARIASICGMIGRVSRYKLLAKPRDVIVQGN